MDLATLSMVKDKNSEGNNNNNNSQGVVYVDFTKVDNSTYTSSLTISEIANFVESGKVVVAQIGTSAPGMFLNVDYAFLVKIAHSFPDVTPWPETWACCFLMNKTGNYFYDTYLFYINETQDGSANVFTCEQRYARLVQDPSS